ncbi:hypothetical protein ACF061_23725 [Streptomyces sp. NPDC015220]|uniref:hypothetical protein n=1 Tax=Streptomyces sp. NPDC015220 TaxID=3364947 RepID=UPI0036F745F0
MPVEFLGITATDASPAPDDDPVAAVREADDGRCPGRTARGVARLPGERRRLGAGPALDEVSPPARAFQATAGD